MADLINYLKEAIKKSTELGSNIQITSANCIETESRDKRFSISYEDKVDVVGNKLRKPGIKKTMSIKKFNKEIKAMKDKIKKIKKGK